MIDNSNLLAAWSDKPLALLPAAWAGLRVALENMGRDGWGAPSGRAVAVIPIYGPIAPRPGLVEWFSGSSTQRIRGDLRRALADKTVTGILFDVDSPGGSVDDITELSAEIFAARAKKPVTAVVNTLGASAAFWLASGAGRLLATPSAQLGGVGVWAAHVDLSGALDKAGERVTVIASNPRKVETLPFAPLSAEAQAYLQGEIDRYYGLFVRDLARNRNTTGAAVRAGFGAGRVMGPRAALEAGMIDGLATFDEAVRWAADPERQSARAQAEARLRFNLA